ncbi:MAG: BatD family protein [Alphaproteobacteria bacterium]|nr:BatD family protein [Alphaproteobacteria bacterium]
MVKFIVFLCLSVFYSLQAGAAPYRLTLEFTPPPETLYLGQESFFQIKLLDRIGLTDVGIVPADWQNVDIFLDPGRPDETAVRNGITYSVKTLYFSLVAKSTGKISFQPFCLSALAPTMISARDLPPGVRIMPGGRLEICTPSFSFDVKALPDHFPPLFAAAQVELFEGVLPKERSVRQGTPVKRSLVLTAKGTLPAYLPDFQTQEQKNVRIYKGKTDRTMITGKRELISAVRQTVVFVPERTGELVLPGISIFWLNTRTRQIEESKIPPYTLTVLPAGQLEYEQKPPAEAEPAAGRKSNVRTFFSFVMRSAGVCLLLILAAVPFIPFLKKRLKRKNLVKAVERACLSDDPEKAASALLAWARDKFPDRRIIDLSDIRESFNGQAADFIAALNELELFLYGTGRFARHLPAARETLGKKLLQAFYAAEQVKIKRRAGQKKHLPDLYPDQ